MNHQETSEEKERKFKFYRSDGAKKYLKKYGVPKNGREMNNFVSGSYPDASPELIESLRQVRFDVHPQQINIRDKTTQELIISLER